MAEYIDKEKLLQELSRMSEYCQNDNKVNGLTALFQVGDAIMDCPTADVVEVVRCKDCIYFQPEFILTNDGERRPYTEQEIKNGKVVSMDVGINCGSRCERFGYWEENKIPVWFDENDFCSYGKRRKEDGNA